MLLSKSNFGLICTCYHKNRPKYFGTPAHARLLHHRFCWSDSAGHWPAAAASKQGGAAVRRRGGGGREPVRERERGTKVHKCQGMTLDRVIVDLKHFTFGKTPYASCPEPAIDWRWQVALEPVVGCGGCRRGCAKPTFCVRLPPPSSGSVVSLQSSRTQRSSLSCDYSRRWLYVGGQAGG